MTIGKKLYAGFGSILVILIALFVVNIVAGLKEQSARGDASNALQSVRTIESVRYQIMLNRNNLNNFLLSGDPRDEEKVNRGLVDLGEMIKRSESQSATGDLLRTALIQVESTEVQLGRQFRQAIAGQAAPSRFRRCDGVGSADFLLAEGSDVVVDEILGGPGSDKRRDHEVSGRND